MDEYAPKNLTFLFCDLLKEGSYWYGVCHYGAMPFKKMQDSYYYLLYYFFQGEPISGGSKDVYIVKDNHSEVTTTNGIHMGPKRSLAEVEQDRFYIENPRYKSNLKPNYFHDIRFVSKSLSIDLSRVTYLQKNKIITSGFECDLIPGHFSPPPMSKLMVTF